MSWFIIALLVPLIIHLFYFRRIKPVIFTGVRILKEIVQEKKNTRNVKHLILLLLRTAFFACLVIAFISFRSISQKPNGSALYLLDNSISSTLQGEGQGTILNTLLRFVDLSVDQNSDFSTQQVASFSQSREMAINSFNKDEVISKLGLSRDVNSYSETLRRHIDRDWKEIYVLSDFQGSNIAEQLERVASSTTLNLIHGQTRDRSNVYVDSIYIENLFLSPSEDNLLIIKLGVENYRASSEITVRLLNEDFLLSTYSVTVDKSEVILKAPIDASSLRNGNIIVQILDPDVEYDNRYYLSVPKYQKVKVVHLYDGIANPYLKNVYSNEELFEYTRFSTSNPSYESIENADLVLIDQVSTIPEFILSGKLNSVLLIPPSAPLDSLSYSRYLGVQLSKKEKGINSSIDPISLNHEVFRGTFQDVDQSTRLPNAMGMFNLGAGSIGDKVLVDLFQRTLLLKLRNAGKRFEDLYFFTFPFDLEFTDLMTHSVFPPVMYNIAFQSKKMQPIHSFRLDERYIETPLSFSTISSPLNIVKDSVSFVTNYVKDGEILQIELPPELNAPGFYSIISEEDTVMTFALNYPVAESLMEFATEEELTALSDKYPNINYTPVNSVEYISQASLEYTSFLWLTSLLLAVMFYLGELLVSRFL